MTPERRREIKRKWRNANRSQIHKYNVSKRGRELSSARNHRYRQSRYLNIAVIQARHRANKLGIVCTITPADLALPTVCPVLGIPIIRGKKRTDNSPSLDRIIPSLGYVPGNVRIISFRANAIKRDATAGELRKVAEYIERNAPTTS